MAWYGRRRTGEANPGAPAAIAGLVLAMLGFLAVQTSTAVRSGMDRSRASMDGAAANLASFATSVTSWSIGFSGGAQEEVERLQRENLELQRYKELSETMVLRMERYEQLLNLVGETQPPALTARVVAEVRGPFAAAKIANAGHAEGVREGFAAVNANGLVGRVIRVGEHTSRILMVTDFNSRIPVMGQQSGDRALMVGDSETGARLVEPETPERIVPGEIWVTSGDDGQLPLGIRVGRSVRQGDEWRIELSMQDGAVDFVRLAPPPDFAAPEAAPATELDGAAPNTPTSLRSEPVASATGAASDATGEASE